MKRSADSIPDNSGQASHLLPPLSLYPSRGFGYLPELYRAAANGSSQTALHFASSKSNLDAARKLLAQKPPASARVRDKRGQYALHRAAAVGSVPMVNLLLGARSPLNATDSAGYTALHHAVAEGHGKLPALTNVLASKLSACLERGEADTSCPEGDTAVALLKAGAETDKKDSDGFLALDLAPDKEVGSLQCRQSEVISLTRATLQLTRFSLGSQVHRTGGRAGRHRSMTNNSLALERDWGYTRMNPSQTLLNGHHSITCPDPNPPTNEILKRPRARGILT